MSRKIVIGRDKITDQRIFIAIGTDDEHLKIQCAYDGNRVCSPDCAACELWGSARKASCIRDNKEFAIGLV